jgi:dTDP-4-dehydrorhamnose reductase
MANILILGNGYTGSEVFKEFVNTSHVCYIVGRDTFDYHDQSNLRHFIFNKNINYVINCFGFTGKPNVDEAETRKKECWYLNVLAPLTISNTCKALNVNYIHISSGCIYSGYDKVYTEIDEPNFGLYNNSSFYSKSKHAYETLADYGAIIRIRMPISNTLVPRNYLTKILNYNMLVTYTNSKTYLPDLAAFIRHLVDTQYNINSIGVLNFVNPEARDTEFIVNKMHNYNIVNDKWKFVHIDTLNLAAPRSNCVLSIDKLVTLFPDFNLHTEEEAVSKALSKALLNSQIN